MACPIRCQASLGPMNIPSIFLILLVFLIYFHVSFALRRESAQSTLIATVEQIMQLVKFLEVPCILKTLASLCFNTSPVPFSWNIQIHIREINREITDLLLTTGPTSRSLGQKRRGATKDNGWVHSEATQLEDVLANRRRIYPPLPATSSVLWTSYWSLECRIEPRCRLGSSFRDIMCNDIQPLAVPAENTTPHLEARVRRNLALEAALDGTKYDAHLALDGKVCLGV